MATRYSQRSRNATPNPSSSQKKQKKESHDTSEFYSRISPAKPSPKEQKRQKGVTRRDAVDKANAALNYFNKKLDTDDNTFELVDVGCQGMADILRGPITHINFEAKPKDGPDELKQTFFAQLRSPNKDFIVDLCVPLGCSNNLPESTQHHSCTYCSQSVFHPESGWLKLLMGLVNEDNRWLYGDPDGPRADPYADVNLDGPFPV